MIWGIGFIFSGLGFSAHLSGAGKPHAVPSVCTTLSSHGNLVAV